MRIAVHTEIPQTPDLRARWNAVASQMQRSEIFYTYEWALAVRSAYSTTLKPLLLLGYEGDDLIGVASLCTDAAGKNIVFLAAATADYCDFLTLPGFRERFLDAVLSELGSHSFSSLTLANLPADSATVDALHHAAETHGLQVFARPAYLCAQVQLGSPENRQRLKASLLGKKKLRRYLREMERTGPVTFAHLKARTEIEAALPEFASAHVARFKATGRTSSLATVERRMFLNTLVKQFDGTGAVTLSQLKIANQTVAWNFGFQFHQSWFWYQPTFDSRHEANSPGHCLLSRIVIEACDMGEMDVVDLGLGAEGYKERFGNGTRQTLHVSLTPSSTRHWLEVARYKAASALKRSPRLDSAVRRALGR